MKKFLFLFAILISDVMMCQLPSTGLVERFMFNNNLNGQMGNFFTSLKPAYDTDRFGNANAAYKIVIDSNCIINGLINSIPQGNSNRSVCLWVKNLGNPIGIRSYFNYSLAYNCFGFAQENAPNNKVVTNYSSNIPSSQAPDNNWHCLIASHSSGITSFYIDGVLIGSAALTYNNNTSLVRMGHSPSAVGTGVPYFGFSVDELLIYNRPLTSTEVIQICSLGNSVDELNDITSSTLVYPVPASKTLTIHTNEPFQLYEICDITGKLITQGSVEENRISFDVIPGMYFLKLITKENKTITKKIIIE